MAENLRVSMIQTHIIWEDLNENLGYYGELLRRISGKTDLAVLPETFTTGFSMNVEELADDAVGVTVATVKKWASNYQMAIAGSFIAKENGKFYNRAFFITPEGEASFYDKRHLFSYSGEDKIYTAGKERKINDYTGFKILLQVCFDLRFPVFSRNQNDYDAVLYVANWPKSRVEAWKSLLKARSIENQAFLFGLNRIGIDGYNLEYEESSLVYFPDGREISERKNNLIITEWNLQELKEYRNKFPFLNERDVFEISL